MREVCGNNGDSVTLMYGWCIRSVQAYNDHINDLMLNPISQKINIQEINEDNRKI